MKTEAELTTYLAQLDQTDEQLENELQNHRQLHQLYPDAGHERSQVLTERKLLAVRAKAAALEWILESDSGYIPRD